MKLFTRSVLAAVALSMMAVPMAQAQSRYGAGSNQSYGHHQQWKKPAKKQQQTRRYAPGQHHAQRPAPSRHHWAKGKRVPDWQRRQAVRDYHRYGLHRPGQGQQWVRIDNDYLLISLATGVILGLAAGR